MNSAGLRLRKNEPPPHTTLDRYGAAFYLISWFSSVYLSYVIHTVREREIESVRIAHSSVNFIGYQSAYQDSTENLHVTIDIAN